MMRFRIAAVSVLSIAGLLWALGTSAVSLSAFLGSAAVAGGLGAQQAPAAIAANSRPNAVQPFYGSNGAGWFNGEFFSSATLATVPSRKTFIIEQLTLWCQLPSARLSEIMIQLHAANGAVEIYYVSLPSSGTGTFCHDQLTAHTPVKIYVPGDWWIDLVGILTEGVDGGRFVATVNGYLVDK
jgi:hypothetical protein